MSSSIPVSLHPVVICDDRYSGVYSGGEWWAVARADYAFDGFARIAWLWEHGPGGDDVDAAVFWNNRPPWIAAGATPDEAIRNLLANKGADSDVWTPRLIEQDPRYRSSLFSPRRSTD